MDTYLLLINAISGVITAIGLLYAGKQIALLKETHKQNHDWNRRNAAQHAIKQLVELTPIVIRINKVFDISNTLEGIPLEETLKQFNSDKELQSHVHQLLNLYEGLARGILQGIYDEKVIYEGRRSSMIQTFENFKPYIRYRRKNVHSSAYELTECIVNKWKTKMSEKQQRELLGTL